MTARIALALGLVIAATGTAAADEPNEPVIQRSSLEVAPGKRSIPAVVIDNPLGDVRIEGHDGPGVVIITTKRAPDEDTIDRLRVSLLPDPDGTVRLSTAITGTGAPIPKGTVRIDLVIKARRNARIDGRVGNGTLLLTNMDAGGELDAATGRIEVKNVQGPVTAHSVDAPMSMSEVFGAVDAQVLAGDIRLDTVRGERLTASAHRGKIQGRRVASRDVDLTTTNGDISYEGESPLGGSIRIATLRGSIDVRLRGAGGLAVRARGQRVDMTRGIKGDDGVYTARFGRGGKPSKVELRTRHGNILFAFIE